MAVQAGMATGELTSFVGRRQELADVRRLFSTARLVTLTGIGGVGKTRLALRLAAGARRAFPDGVCVVELASLTDPELLPHYVAERLEIREQSARAPLDILCDHLRSQRMLLVMDNCEHLVTAVADLVDTVLRASPGLRVLATSTQPLRLSAEHVFSVPPLPAPGVGEKVAPGTATQYPSVALFADRCAAVVPDFALTPDNEAAVAQLCQRLEGIPLAIELATARVKVLSIEGLIRRLDDRFLLLREGSRDLPERHRTLQAVIDWSYDLCTPQEQALWTRASVFSGGFTVEALEQVCTDDSLPAEAILDTITGLLDKSIVFRDQAGSQVRFDMLDTIRAYGRAALASSGHEQDLRRRHRDWCLGLLESAGQAWTGARQQDWATTLLLERPNLRAALEWSLAEPGEARVAQRMAALPWFWLALGQLAEGRYWLERAISLDGRPSLERSWALSTDAYLAASQGNTAVVPTLIQQARDAAPDERAAQAYAQHVLGVQRMINGDLKGAVALLEQALDDYDSDLPEQYSELRRIALASACLYSEDLDRAETIYDDVIRRSSATGERWHLSYALWGRAHIALMRGELHHADVDVCEAIRIKRSFHDSLGLALAIDLLAWITVAQGDPRRGATLLGGASVVWKDVGSELIGARNVTQVRRRFELMARDAIGDDEFHAAFDHGTALAVEEVIALAVRERPARSSGSTPRASTVLTRREREVAALVGAGLSNKEIAAKLVISVRTAEAHVEHILSKLGFTTRAQVAHWIAQQQ